jgi:hypothetical protein
MIEREIFKERNSVKKLDRGVVRGGRGEETRVGNAGLGDDEAFGVLDVTIVTVFIEMRMERYVRTFEAIEEVIVISVVVVIKDGRVPRGRMGHDLLRQGGEFMVSGWTHGYVW